MDLVRLVFLVLLYRSSVDAGQNDKRLVLHSDTDVVQEINKLRAELNNQNSKIQNLTTTQGLLTSKLQEKDANIQNLTTSLNEHTSEIQALKSDHQATVSDLNNNEAKLRALEQTVAKQPTHAAGSSYVRWGRTRCPGNGTTLAYSGYMAGAKYSETGGATNYLCLAGQPTWDYYEEGTDSGSRIYGVEYQFDFHHAASRTKFFGTDLLNDDAPCAVCHTVRGSNIMIPGRTDCYDGWTKEYSGYIVAEHYNYVHGTEYVCLDRRPEVVVGGKDSHDESMLWLVTGRCGGSLECPPYINGRELACVVCSA